jgi:hypothetical protein
MEKGMAELQKTILILRWDIGIITNEKLRESKLAELRGLERELALLKAM